MYNKKSENEDINQWEVSQTLQLWQNYGHYKTMVISMKIIYLLPLISFFIYAIASLLYKDGRHWSSYRNGTSTTCIIM